MIILKLYRALASLLGGFAVTAIVVACSSQGKNVATAPIRQTSFAVKFPPMPVSNGLSLASDTIYVPFHMALRIEGAKNFTYTKVITSSEDLDIEIPPGEIRIKAMYMVLPVSRAEYEGNPLGLCKASRDSNAGIDNYSENYFTASTKLGADAEYVSMVDFVKTPNGNEVVEVVLPALKAATAKVPYAVKIRGGSLSALASVEYHDALTGGIMSVPCKDGTRQTAQKMMPSSLLLADTIPMLNEQSVVAFRIVDGDKTFAVPLTLNATDIYKNFYFLDFTSTSSSISIAMDADFDSDGISNAAEVAAGTNPLSSVVFTPTITPTAAPTSAVLPDVMELSAIGLSDTSIGLAWISGGGATNSYRLTFASGVIPPESCTTGTLIPVEQMHGTTHTVTNLAPNVMYAFRVCTVGMDASVMSGGATIKTTTLQTPPLNVTSLLAVPTSDTAIALSWKTGGGSTAGYVASYDRGPTAPATCALGTPLTQAQISDITASVAGLTGNTQYSFRVCAVNSDAIPVMSSGTVVSATTLQMAPPNVTSLSAVGGSTAIVLGWTSGGGSTVTYKVSYESGATAPATCALGTALSQGQISGANANVTGLTVSTQYSFRVCTVNGNPTPDVSSGTIVTATTLQAVAPNVTSLAATILSDTALNLSWASGWGTTAGYRISYATGSVAPTSCAAGTALPQGQISGTTASVIGLNAYTPYAFRVCAINGNPTPDVSSGTITNVTTIPAAPGNLSGTGGANFVTLSWSTVAGASSYTIYYSTAPGVTKAASHVVASAPSYQVTALNAATTYYFNITVIAGGIESNLSGNETSATTLDMVPPSIGSALIFTAVASTTLTVNWGAANDAVTPTASLQYKLVKSIALANIDTVGEVDAITGGDVLLDWTANTLSKAVTGLIGSTAYYFAVMVQDAHGNKALYAPLSQVTIPGDYTSAHIGTLKAVPPGTFQRDATPTNLSTVAGFHMGEKEITRAQFMAVTALADPSTVAYSTGTTDPVQTVNWYHALVFCNKLSMLEGLAPVYSIYSSTDPAGWGTVPTTTNSQWDTATVNWGSNGYRLPTEMEWMWAAMGGNDAGGNGYLKAFAGSTGANIIDNYVWYTANSMSKTHPVGIKLPNELGLYDISGNVFEWNWDWYAMYPAGTLTDYRGAASGASRVVRGGSWNYAVSYDTVAYRNNILPYDLYDGYGFRVVRQ